MKFSVYLKSHAAPIVYFFACFGLAGAVMYLYGRSAEPVLYTGVLCAAAGAGLIAVDFVHEKRRAASVRDAASRLPAQLVKLPCRGGTEEEYRALVNKLYESYNDSIAAGERRYRDMQEYYTLWAHQIKTPIAAIGLILQSAEFPQRCELSAKLASIEQYADMVMNYVRLTGDGNDFVFRSCRLDAVIRPAIRRFSQLFILKKLSVKYVKTDETALTDEKWLRFVIEQLLSNSLKYTEKGGITITVTPLSEVVIEDTGVGILPEDLPRVCERGYTGMNGRRERSSTGIGLYLCRMIIKKLGHSMKIESQPGKGTRVTIDLSHVSVSAE